MTETLNTCREGQEELVSACLEKARQYGEKGLHEEAVKVLKAALNLEPDNTEVLLTLGSAYRELKKFDEALSHFQQAHLLDPNDYYAVWLMSDTFILANRWGDAIGQLEKLYLLDQGAGLKLFNNVFISFNQLLFSCLLQASSKHAEHRESAGPR
jgi:tetratricopeptide (TPR) repeat protein